jgi:hypothetical protein
MVEQKIGLHKKISSIFDGVPKPGQDTSDAVKSPGIKGLDDAEAVGQSSRNLLRTLNESVPDSQEEKIPSYLRKAVREVSGPSPVSGRMAPRAKKTVLRSQKNMAFMVIGLVIVLAVVVLRPFWGSLTSKKTNINSETATDVSITKSLSEKTQVKWEKPSLLPAMARDLMKYTSRPGGSDSNEQVSIHGIVIGASKSSVIIEGSVLHEGDTANGANILKISQGVVEFEKEGKKWTQSVK